ncbi:hypothetical protein B296_00045036 [Ensete ventricosum]|uniref:Uncharacterized protein n=1 Tax=Ensete ventricosum TaxID=4639 RepID=A0A426Z8T3_ENSVE|nr:hypothetical protein B296_00045036 [Ensete ventricosum]
MGGGNPSLLVNPISEWLLVYSFCPLCVHDRVTIISLFSFHLLLPLLVSSTSRDVPTPSPSGRRASEISGDRPSSSPCCPWPPSLADEVKGRRLGGVDGGRGLSLSGVSPNSLRAGDRGSADLISSHDKDRLSISPRGNGCSKICLSSAHGSIRYRKRRDWHLPLAACRDVSRDFKLADTFDRFEDRREACNVTNCSS